MNIPPEAAKRGRESQQFTRRWYKDTLLKIFRGEIKCTSTQLTALCKFADQRGWVAPNRPRVKPIADRRSKCKPEVSTDVLQRLAYFNVTTNQTHPQSVSHSNATRQQA